MSTRDPDRLEIDVAYVTGARGGEPDQGDTIAVSLVDSPGSEDRKLRFDGSTDTLFELPVSSSCPGPSWAAYLLALRAIDLAEVNLGSRVLVGGTHVVDVAVRNILDAVGGIVVVESNGSGDADLDSYIGCDEDSLGTALGSLNRMAIAVRTCSPHGTRPVDVYTDIHRRGLTLRSLCLESSTVAALPDLSRRLERLVARSPELESDMSEITNTSG